MQTGTTPPRRTATEPPSDRSTPGTGPCPRPRALETIGREETPEVAA
ncbi:hypothetical protein [uncultured Halorubrum sp.]|nr:hypothetical protein [uncultured Halorubrum sp.]